MIIPRVNHPSGADRETVISYVFELPVSKEMIAQPLTGIILKRGKLNHGGAISGSTGIHETFPKEKCFVNSSNG